jgi:hypothetical protein
MKISYQTERSNSGTVYNQTISTTPAEFNKINKYLQSIDENQIQDNERRFYFRQLDTTPAADDWRTTKYFLNLTQLYYIKKFLNNKRILQRNTILKVNHEKNRIKTCYKIEPDAYGQRGTDIDRIELTKREYKKRENDKTRNYFITDDYTTALYYTQD